MKTYKDFINEAALAAGEFVKYQWRRNLFADNYKANKPFTLKGGKTLVSLRYDKKIDRILRKGSQQQLRKVKLTDKNSNKLYPLGMFQKTAEYGGKDSRFSVAVEDRALKGLNNQFIDAMVETGKSSVDIYIGNKLYKNIVGAVSTPGTPKSDFHLINDKGKEMVWISHKGGSTAKDFGQWGGVTEKGIKDHPEIMEFARQIKEMFPDNEFPKKTTIGKEIKDVTLMNQSVYGHEYGGALSKQNVTLLLQGDVNLVKRKKHFTLSATNVHVNGEIMKGDFQPVLVVRYAGGRRNFGINGARFSIYSKTGRKVHKWIK